MQFGDRTQINVTLEMLTKDSNIRRNHLVLEEVVRQREKQQWLDVTSQKIHERSRDSQSQLQSRLRQHVRNRSYNLVSGEMQPAHLDD
jgi:hypothetical protein